MCLGGFAYVRLPWPLFHFFARVFTRGTFRFAQHLHKRAWLTCAAMPHALAVRGAGRTPLEGTRRRGASTSWHGWYQVAEINDFLRPIRELCLSLAPDRRRPQRCRPPRPSS